MGAGAGGSPCAGLGPLARRAMAIVRGFLEQVERIDFEHKVTMGTACRARRTSPTSTPAAPTSRRKQHSRPAHDATSSLSILDSCAVSGQIVHGQIAQGQIAHFLRSHKQRPIAAALFGGREELVPCRHAL